MDEDEISNETTALLSNSINENNKINNHISYGTKQDTSQYLDVLLTAISDRRSKFQQNISFIIILAVNALERFAYYGLICNYILYLNKNPLSWESYNASLVLLMLLGFTNISSCFGGWIADSFLGKFKTIMFSFFVYIFGYAAFPLLASKENNLPEICLTKNNSKTWFEIESWKNLTNGESIFNKVERSIATESCSWVIIISSLMIGIAVGFIRANLGAFGADQVLSRGQNMIFKFFNWFYWSINLGSLLSFLILAYLQQNLSFFIGYIIPLTALLFSFILFIAGNFSYIKNQPTGSILTNIFRIIYEAYQTTRRKKRMIEQKKREEEYF